ncbi:VWA domain-containing protein [Neobacillus notoginsengisoli]|uniref:VWA domain-containing protein n=1 Tax=Neobacillus notoginsengisoli TaxID=1578198 RepID=A0A417YS49_9BACI|nr:VWA domain-containing protein [Neobacillus notoginsengisoli]RHW38116.1 VWA domain-containing protein [Neobacillus notoginsengisoli]
MRMKKKKLFLFAVLLFSIVLVLSACGAKEKASGDKNKNEETAGAKEKDQKHSAEAEEKEDEFKIASSVEDIIEEKAGKYSGNAYNKAVVHRALDEKSFQDKDSFQVYEELLNLIREGENYRPFYDFYESFNPSIETSLTKMPGGMKLSDDGDLDMNVNIAILLDASGSMAQKIGGKTKMELAKDAINQFVASMPEEANVSLRVYGHKGSNSDSDKQLSCGSTEVVYELKPYNEADFKSSLGKFQPTGWTPIANAISETKADFERAGNEGENIIYVVSDGVETCDGDPVKAAKELHDSNIKAVVNIIGFDVDSQGQKQLIAVAEAGGGEYETVKTAKDFEKLWEEERRRLWNEWWNWGSKNWNEVWNEQTKKSNELFNQKSKFSNLTYDEKSRLTEASYYLKDKDQISYEVRQEVDSLIQQRFNIMRDYVEEKYKEKRDTLKTEGDNLKKSIKEKEEEMKAKYKS